MTAQRLDILRRDGKLGLYPNADEVHGSDTNCPSLNVTRERHLDGPPLLPARVR